MTRKYSTWLYRNNKTVFFWLKLNHSYKNTLAWRYKNSLLLTRHQQKYRNTEYPSAIIPKSERQQQSTLKGRSEAVTVALFSVPKMDCPAEETEIRITLVSVDKIKGFYFDFGKRQVHIFHAGDNSHLIEILTSL